MLRRAHIIIAAAAFVITPCYAAQSSFRDGSTMEKAIPLKQRRAKAVEEEMQLMVKLCHYTPVLAMRDVVVDAVRQIKAGKKKSLQDMHPWEHASPEDHGKLISYRSFVTPRGKKEFYFDTGESINTPGEVVRQESSRAQYMARTWQSFNVQ